MFYNTSLGKWLSHEHISSWTGSGGRYQWSHNTTVSTGYSGEFFLHGTEDYALKVGAGLDCQIRYIWGWTNDSNSTGIVWWDIAGESETGNTPSVAFSTAYNVNGGSHVTLTTSWQTTSHADSDEADWRTLGATWDAANRLIIRGGIQSNASPGNTTTSVSYVRQMIRWISV
jgi:hypothetical protein